jgi:hypothetical protein
MSTSLFSLKFIRRSDLDSMARLRIASLALVFYKHGLITNLSKKYEVSRPFIYQLRDQLAEFGESQFCACGNIVSPAPQDIVTCMILSLRLEGKSPISGISSILTRFNHPGHSTGHISETLKRIGLAQGNTLDIGSSEVSITFCSDEIFANGQCILMTVCPISICILRIELVDRRDGENWSNHWFSLRTAGFTPQLLCNDEGLGMASAATQVLNDVPRQSDTFHAVAHRLGKYKDIFGKNAEKNLEKYYLLEQKVQKAKSKAMWDKQFDQYVAADIAANTAIALSDNFNFLYHCLLEAFHLFDDNGDMTDIATIIGDFDAALELLQSLQHADINKEIKTIRACKHDLSHFRGVAQQIVYQLSQKIPVYLLKPLLTAWQAHKNSCKAKQTNRKNALLRKEQHYLQQIEALLPDEVAVVQHKKMVYNQLNNIIQSSAAVECVNSILRPYLAASKNQVTQHSLNLFMAYHNHRRFLDGERKGKTPFELLTNSVQHDDWMTLMLKKAA